ncbi:MAG: hypothetical protein AAF206_04460 [Bacteroidota bacterium]
MFSSRTQHILSFGLLAGLYMLFPNQNQGIDAWGYAAQIKWGQELFLHHHLLYNAFWYAMFQTVHAFLPMVDAMRFLQFGNACTALACLWQLRLVLRDLGRDQTESLLWVFLVGLSFGVWRYAVDNETYLLPIFFSLLGSRFFLKASGKGAILMIAGSFAAMAMLFHQIHLFWWIGLALAGLWCFGWKKAAVFVLPAIVVPLVYLLAMHVYWGESLGGEQIIRFVLHDFYGETTDSGIALKHFLLTPVNLFRSFLQVHGQVWVLLQKFPAFWIVGLIAISSLLIGLWHSRRLIFRQKQIHQTFIRIHIGIFVLQLLFAFYAAGNAEFMVMLPFLLAIIVSTHIQLPQKSLLYLMMGFLLWNGSFSIIPNALSDWFGSHQVVNEIVHKPDQRLLLADKNIIANRLWYQSGVEWGETMISYTPDQPENMMEWMRQFPPETTFLTNVPDYPVWLDRARILSAPEQARSFFPESIKKTKTIRCGLGQYGLYTFSVTDFAKK